MAFPHCPILSVMRANGRLSAPHLRDLSERPWVVLLAARKVQARRRNSLRCSRKGGWVRFSGRDFLCIRACVDGLGSRGQRLADVDSGWLTWPARHQSMPAVSDRRGGPTGYEELQVARVPQSASERITVHQSASECIRMHGQICPHEMLRAPACPPLCSCPSSRRWPLSLCRTRTHGPARHEAPRCTSHGMF